MEKVKFKNKEYFVEHSAYVNGGKSIRLMKGFHPEVTCTAWIPGLGADELAIKDYSENFGVLDCLVGSEIVQPPHRYVQSGFVHFPIVRLKS